MAQLIPIFRSFDETKAREFYVDFLGFSVTFEHRFDQESPLYMGLVFRGVELHLSEHHGDATPGGRVRVEIDQLEEFHQELLAKSYRFARPGFQEQEWGFFEVSVKDPFGNCLVFCEPHESVLEARKNHPNFNAT